MPAGSPKLKLNFAQRVEFEDPEFICYRLAYPATWRVGGQLPKLWRNDWFLVGNAIKVADFWQLDPEGNSDHLGQAVNLRVTAARIDARPFSVLEGEE
ncbi:hypothetical protein VWX35_00855 [Phaeobacter sp. A36a-5a]|uniref:hypothetical protein n=1 Tax=Phaeobacter bryozoorum TaxID=1086632 RepID=UPI0030C8DDC9